MNRKNNTCSFTETKSSESTFLLTLETTWVGHRLQGGKKEEEIDRGSRRRTNTKNMIAKFP